MPAHKGTGKEFDSLVDQKFDDNLKKSGLENRLKDADFRLNKAKNRPDKLVIRKHLYKENDFYILDYTFPYLNDQIHKSYEAFNIFIEEHYLNIKRTAGEILEDKELLCDTLKMELGREKRVINYKLHFTKDDLLSLVIYKENHYAGAIPPNNSFSALNFDLNTGKFLDYDDFFQRDSEQEVLLKINEIIKRAIISGEMFYDCWQISSQDFEIYKSNFVVNDTTIEFYFDDCIMCPVYTGIYSLEMPKWELKEALKSYQYPQLPLL